MNVCWGSLTVSPVQCHFHVLLRSWGYNTCTGLNPTSGVRNQTTAQHTSCIEMDIVVIYYTYKQRLAHTCIVGLLAVWECLSLRKGRDCYSVCWCLLPVVQLLKLSDILWTCYPQCRQHTVHYTTHFMTELFCQYDSFRCFLEVTLTTIFCGEVFRTEWLTTI